MLCVHATAAVIAAGAQPFDICISTVTLTTAQHTPWQRRQAGICSYTTNVYQITSFKQHVILFRKHGLEFTVQHENLVLHITYGAELYSMSVAKCKLLLLVSAQW
jgi:hypothetical protein